MNKFISKENLTFYFKGLGLDEGPLPAFFYFALTAEESLEVPPYNAPTTPFATPLDNRRCRVFSITLPAHDTKSSLESQAIKTWGEEIVKGHYLLEDFIDKVAASIHSMIEEGIVDKNHLVLGGLSRGVFIATHVAAKVKEVKALLGFAPLLNLNHLEEFAPHLHETRFLSRLERLDCASLVEHLTHLHFLRFYIGNRDTRVGTDACYHFIRKLADKAHEKHARHFHIELFISQSTGHKGHGTAPHIFQEGALWLKKHLFETSP